jgi:hypothetical protein
MQAGLMKTRLSADKRGEINAPIQGGKRANHLSKKKADDTCFPIYPAGRTAGNRLIIRQFPA